MDHYPVEEKFRKSLSGFAFTSELLGRFRAVVEAPAIEPGISDRDEAPIVAAALSANASMFITGDKELLALNEIEGMPILSPREEWVRLFQAPESYQKATV